MTALKTLISEAEYLAIEEVDGGPRYELDEGELVEMASPSLMHNDVRGITELLFRLYLRRNPAGVVTSETDCRLSKNLIRRPDLMFFLNETLEGVDHSKVPIPVVPEFVLEVVSPSESASDIERRLRQYERAGVRMIVMIYPEDRFATAHLDGRRIEIDQTGKIEIPFLPGLDLPLAELLKGVPAGR
ncbi:MAG: Uma2 family endonuclease [Bryobacteraceae bacterium]|nr:Uma2 family endonuclease [Bryobacteraceae bacterium]